MSTLFAFEKYKFRNVHFPLLLSAAALCILGYIVLQSAVINDADGPETMKRQLMGFLVGSLIALLFMLIDYHVWLRIPVLLYIGMLGFLALTYTSLGVSRTNATRWVRLPLIGRVQPSEFCKVALILFFAWFFARYAEQLNRWKYVLLTLALFFIPTVLVLMEPDLSTTITYFLIFAVMLYVAKLSYRRIAVLVAGMVPIAGFLIWDAMRETHLILKPYMVNRILSFLSPDEYSATGLVDQQDRAVMAISSGQLRGKGLFATTFESVKNGKFLSEENCDFIFAVVGEELGFLGSVTIILLFALLVFSCFRIAAQARDMGGRMIAVGVGTFIGVQVFFNIGVTSGILPNTGVVLPFFSAGISSLFSIFAALGLVLNVALERQETGNPDW